MAGKRTLYPGESWPWARKEKPAGETCAHRPGGQSCHQCMPCEIIHQVNLETVVIERLGALARQCAQAHRRRLVAGLTAHRILDIYQSPWGGLHPTAHKARILDDATRFTHGHRDVDQREVPRVAVSDLLEVENRVGPRGRQP